MPPCHAAGCPTASYPAPATAGPLPPQGSSRLIQVDATAATQHSTVTYRIFHAACIVCHQSLLRPHPVLHRPNNWHKCILISIPRCTTSKDLWGSKVSFRWPPAKACKACKHLISVYHMLPPSLLVIYLRCAPPPCSSFSPSPSPCCQGAVGPGGWPDAAAPPAAAAG